MKVGVLGMGIMGSRMAANLLKAGHELWVWNRSAGKDLALIDQGAHRASDPATLAAAVDVVITMLPSPKVVQEVALGSDGFLAAMPANGLWMDCSTVTPDFSRAMAQTANRLQIRFLDAPVAGTKGPAEKGELVFLVGGQEADVTYVQPLLDIMGKKTIHLGVNGMGSNMKLLINQLLGQSMLAFSEAFAQGQAMGLASETLFNVLLNVPVTAPFLQVLRPKLENANREANFPLKWMQKDLHLAANTAFELGLAMPMLNLAKEVFAQAQQAGLGDEDFSSVFHHLQP